MSAASDLVDSLGTIASPPRVYDRLVQVINHPRSGWADMANVISKDQGLTGRLLKLVNSAFFSFPRPVDDVVQAVKVVGTSQIRDLALATSVMSTFRGIPPELVDLDSFWYHSLACGVTSRTLATRRREDNVERFFVAGVLHDIGHLIAYMAAPDAAQEAMRLAQRSGRPLFECEREVLGCDHAAIGRALLDKWNLPHALREAVAFHHQPSAATRFPVEAAAVHVAEVTAHAFEWGRSGERVVPPFDPGAVDVLGLEADQLPLIVADVERQMEAAIHQLGAAA